MSMTDENQGAIDTGESWTPPDQQEAAIDESQGLNTSAPAPQPQGGASLPDMGPPPFAQKIAQQTPAQGLQEAGQGIASDIGQGIENVKSNPVVKGAKRIMALLAGDGAENPAALDQIGAKVDPQGKMTPADRQVAAIHQAYTEGGPDAAAAILQANRVAYSAKTAFARTALTGTAQKPPDLKAAIDAANQAQTHLPDGSNVIFAPGGRGMVVAIASLPGTKRTVQYNLSAQQFSQFLDVGKDGQFDKMMDTSAPVMLQKLAQANSAAPQQAQGGQQDQQAGASDRQQVEQNATAQTAPKRKTNFGKTPSTLNLSGSDEVGPDQSDEARGVRDPELEGRSRAMFPNISQEQDRQRFMASEEEKQAERENKIGVASEKGKNEIEKARVTGTGRTEAARITAEAKERGWKYASDAKRELAAEAMGRAQMQEQGKNQRSALANQMGLIKKKIETGQPLTDEDNALAKKYGAAADQALSAPQVAAPQAPTPQAQAPQARPPNVPPGAKQYQGKWYTRGPNGEAVPVQ